MNPDTIVAPATPPGHGGVSLIRLSGPDSKSIAKKITGFNSLENRRSTFTSILGKGGKIDDVIITFFKSPSSYTGEDVAELSCHGNPTIVDQIISLVCNLGARLAEPGEFTKRAFLNGKLDLIQAESVSGLIGSKSAKAAEINQRVLSGALSKKLTILKETLIGVLAELEFEFDISEDDLFRPNLIPNSLNLINNNILTCDGLLSSFKEGRMYNNGSRVVIFGNPNVGKSTLLNALLEKDRAITSDVPGTTRDTVEAQIILNGIPVTYVDTAGVRESNEPIEADGVRRSMNEIENADLLLHVFTNEDYLVDNIINKQHLKVFNKSDLYPPPKNVNGLIAVSALRGTGIKELKEKIEKSLKQQNCTESDIVLTTRRQVDSISDCKENLVRATAQLNNAKPELELVSFEIREAINNLDVLMGKTAVDEILNMVFSGFCVGK